MRRITLIVCALLAAAGAGLGAATVHAQQAGTIKITAPANGATVTGPVSVTVDIGGVPVKPAAAGDVNAYHYHILVDVDPATVVQSGQPLPTGQANIIHTADNTVPLANLASGQHTVTVVLTKTDHVPLSPSVQDRVQFTVAAAGAAQPAAGAGGAMPAAPRVGTGVASDTTLPLLAIPVAAVAGIAGLILIRRRRAA